MSSDWEASRPYYGSLTLLQDGDEVEKYGAEDFRLHERWPAYEEFWKSHIAPATRRPASIDPRQGISPITSKLMTANYDAFGCVVAACDLVGMLQTDVSFTRKNDWKRLFSRLGSALDAFIDVAEAVAEVLDTLGLPPAPGELMGEDWLVAHGRFDAYQTYLTEQIMSAMEWADLKMIPTALVASKEAALRDSSLGVGRDPECSRLRLVDAGRQHLDDLIVLLNAGQKRLIAKLEPVQSSGQYHELWGWRRS